MYLSAYVLELAIFTIRIGSKFHVYKVRHLGKDSGCDRILGMSTLCRIRGSYKDVLMRSEAKRPVIQLYMRLVNVSQHLPFVKLSPQAIVVRWLSHMLTFTDEPGMTEGSRSLRARQRRRRVELFLKVLGKAKTMMERVY